MLRWPVEGGDDFWPGPVVGLARIRFAQLLDRGGGQREYRGELGGGGTHIRLKNVNGTIDVRHAEDGHTVSPAKDLSEHEKEGEI